MKRFLVLLLFTAFLFCTACTGVKVDPSPTSAPGGTEGSSATETVTDKPYEGRNYVRDFRPTTLGLFGVNNNIVETDDSVFVLGGGYLYFSDKEYRDFMPLCARPNCLHNDDECDARLDTKNGIWLYGSYIWFITNERGILDDANKDPLWLCRMRLDGTKHERVLKFYEGDPDFEVKMNSWDFYSTNKYLRASHVMCDHSNVNHEDAKIETVLYLVDLETLEVKTLEVDPDSPVVLSIVWGDGSLLYGIGVEDAEDPDYDGEQVMQKGVQKTLVVMSPETGEERRIGPLEGKGRIDPYYGGFGLVGSDFIYLRWDNTTDTNSLWAMDIETGECRLLVSKPFPEFRAATYDWTSNTLFLSTKDTGAEGFYAYDLEGNEVAHIPYDGMPKDFIEGNVLFQTDSYIFLCPPADVAIETDGSGGFKFSSETAQIPTWYLEKSKIGTDELAWKRWEP